MSSPSAEIPAAPEPSDPLLELRRGDPRPLTVRWRERAAAQVGSIVPIRAPVAGLVLCGLLVAVVVGWRLVVASQPPVEATIPLARPLPSGSSPTTVPPSSAVVVHVAGAVVEPGLVVAEADWRVADAITAAGGSTPEADLDRINLASLLRDGERIYVPRAGQAIPSVAGSYSSPGPSELEAQPVDLNTADAAALESLPGVGPATARTIIAHREEHGPFGSIEALVAVRGIGPATLEGLRDHVVVG